MFNPEKISIPSGKNLRKNRKKSHKINHNGQKNKVPIMTSLVNLFFSENTSEVEKQTVINNKKHQNCQIVSQLQKRETKNKIKHIKEGIQDTVFIKVELS